jgi:hypothetical protein
MFTRKTASQIANESSMAAFETKFPGVIAQQTPRLAAYRPPPASVVAPPASVVVAPRRPPPPALDIVTVLTDAEMKTLEDFAGRIG